jgi:hypothetical protein
MITTIKNKLSLDRQKLIDLWPLGLLALLSMLAYGQLIHGYFATDEWWAMAFAIAHPTIKAALQPVALYAPSANLFIYWLWYTFGLNAVAWASIVLLLHTLNVLSLYGLTLKLSGNRWVGLLTASLFTLLPMGSQFIHQFSMMPTSGMGTTLALFGLLAYSYRKTWLATLLLMISFSFTTYTIPFIFLFILIEAVMFKRSHWQQSLWRLVPVIGGAALYFTVLKELIAHSGMLYDSPLNTAHVNLWSHIKTTLYKAYEVYGEFYLNYLPGSYDPNKVIAASNAVVMAVLFGCYFLALRRQWQWLKLVLLGLFWLPTSVILFSSLNTVATDATFPGRYLYVAAAGIGLMIGAFIVGALGSGKKMSSAVVGVVTLLAIIIYLPKIQYVIKGEVELGQVRQGIMDDVAAAVPPAQHQHDPYMAFCLTSNQGHYGASPEEMPLPLVHNFSFNLGVLYRSHEPKMKAFFTNADYFVAPGSWWYYHPGFPAHADEPAYQTPGLGYAPNLRYCAMMNSIYTFVPIDSYYGFAYDGKTKKLIDTTAALRRYLKGDATAKADLYPWEKP